MEWGAQSKREQNTVLFGTLFCFNLLAEQGGSEARGELERIRQSTRLDGMLSAEMKEAIKRCERNSNH
jgi:hypothetical protein